MELQKAISERRSNRRYKDKKVFPIDMKEILEAGILAPSPKNRQPWYFHSCGPIRKRLIVDVLQDKIAEMQAESTTVGAACRSACGPLKNVRTLFWFTTNIPGGSRGTTKTAGKRTFCPSAPVSRTCCLPPIPKTSNPCGSATFCLPKKRSAISWRPLTNSWLEWLLASERSRTCHKGREWNCIRNCKNRVESFKDEVNRYH